MKKNDIILLMATLILAIVLFSGYRLFYHKAGDFITVTVDTEIYRTLPLDQDAVLDIPGADGGSNRLEIKNGAASITDADCPDKLCVHQKKIQSQGESLICLPHKVIVTVTSDQKGTLDNISY